MKTVSTPSRLRQIRRWFLLALLTGISWVLVHIVVCVLVGAHDRVSEADLIVVFGNTVNPDGTLSSRLESRLERARDVYESGAAPLVFVSGGLGREGHEEALAMKQYLLAEGIPSQAIVVDQDGYSTYKTARNASAYMTCHRLSRVILVTQYYHIARARLAFGRFGVPSLQHSCARMGPERSEPFALLREFIAYYYYLCRGYERGASTSIASGGTSGPGCTTVY